MSVRVGDLRLKNPVVAASGTFGTGLELAAYVDPSSLGAVTVKSLSAFPWEGNSPPRLKMTPAGMLNSVGLQNPGVDAWIRDTYPKLESTGATVIASIWGRSDDEFGSAAESIARQTEVAAIEVNLSCPNLESASEVFAHSIDATTRVVRAVSGAIPSGGPIVLAKLSPNTPDLVAIAESAVEAGADGLTLINTVIGMSIDPVSGSPATARVPSGLSGPAIRPIAVRCVYEVATSIPGIPIIGTGGVTDGNSAVELMRAGAAAVGIGTASFFDPKATKKIAGQLRKFCEQNGVRKICELTGSGLTN